MHMDKLPKEKPNRIESVRAFSPGWNSHTRKGKIPRITVGSMAITIYLRLLKGQVGRRQIPADVAYKNISEPFGQQTAWINSCTTRKGSDRTTPANAARSIIFPRLRREHKVKPGKRAAPAGRSPAIRILPHFPGQCKAAGRVFPGEAEKSIDFPRFSRYNLTNFNPQICSRLVK